ncbi:hypothetical protein IAG15_27340, partial [Enterococcus faecalis]|nr:hypothetical protein [Enterococcus faecalis]
RDAFRILLRVQPSSSPLHKVFQKGYPIIYKTVTNIKYRLQKAFFAAFRQKKTKNRTDALGIFYFCFLIPKPKRTIFR